MPYGNLAALPSYVKQLPETRQRQWMAVWNSSYAACMRDEFGNVKKCESEAFAKANGVVKGSELDDLNVYSEDQFRLFVESAALRSGADIQDGWFPFLPSPGKYKHPAYGEVDITPEGNMALVDSVKSRVYQDHIPIDAEHQTKLSGAVAWLTDMRMNDDGSADAYLQWTDRGRMLMSGGQFRYISPEFFGRWPDPATGEVHKNVVAGGAITTRPFFKDKVLRALVASERGTEVIDAEAYWFRDFSPEERDQMAKSGVAMPDGNYPIPDADALDRAIKAIGRASDRAATIAHIKKRAKALGKTDLIPQEWSEEFSMKKCPDCGAEVPAGAKTCPDCGAKLMSENPKGGEPETVKMSEVQDKIKEAVDEVTGQFTEQIGALTAQLTSANEAATQQKATIEALQGQLKAAHDADRARRFAELVAGRAGASDGAAWAGDPEKQVSILVKMAETFGEDSDEFRAYVEQQTAVATQLKTTVFKEYGSSAKGAGLSDPDAQLERLAREKAAAEHKPFHQAYSEVLDSDEGRSLYERSAQK